MEGVAEAAGNSEGHPLIIFLSSFFWVIREYKSGYAPWHLLTADDPSVAAVMGPNAGCFCNYNDPQVHLRGVILLNDPDSASQ